jgi:mono/diheme cytochrome c family protein
LAIYFPAPLLELNGETVTRRRFSFGGFVLILAPSLLIAQQGVASDAASGKRMYVQNGCYECHGYAGQGGAAGPRIAPWTLGADSLIAYVRHPAGQMPLYTEKVVPNAELTAIWAYLKSIPAPRSAKDIPLLNDAKSR